MKLSKEKIKKKPWIAKKLQALKKKKQLKMK